MGGQAESHGKDTAQWADATKKQIEEGGDRTGKAAMDTSKRFGQKFGGAMSGKSEDDDNLDLK